MRIAISGKGGIGKTALAAMLCRVLARRGRGVLACDFDLNPGLAYSLGRLAGSGRLPREVVVASDDAEHGYALRNDLDPVEVVGRYAARGADGVRLLALGTIDGATHDLLATHFATRQAAAGFAPPDWDTIVDLEAGTGLVYDGNYASFVDVMVTATDGSAAANLTCRRLVNMTRAMAGVPAVMVATKATPDTDEVAADLAGEMDVALLASIPADAAVRRADVAGEAIVDAAPDCAAVTAVTQLADSLRVTSERVRA